MAAAQTLEHVEKLGLDLYSKDTPIGQRMRNIFYLRSCPKEHTKRAEELLAKALAVKDDSILLRHEIAYVLGQMQSDVAEDTLISILSDTTDDPIVRHECAEALAAIGKEETLEILIKFIDDARPEVSETCKIAVDRVNWAKERKANLKELTPEETHEFESIDPAPALVGEKTEKPELATEEIEQMLLNTELPLFERYRAMFSLRNENSEASVLALAKGLHDESALFRHEIAYVLGQMAHPASIPALSECLQKLSEHGMVRHEAAEALGAIGTPECVELLKEYSSDDAAVVRESCEVALDTVDYWTQFEKVDESAEVVAESNE